MNVDLARRECQQMETFISRQGGSVMQLSRIDNTMLSLRRMLGKYFPQRAM